jgi:putative DNA primase/helicase
MTTQTPEQKAFANAMAKTVNSSVTILKLLSAVDIEPQSIDWLWNGWLARGKLHLLAGAAGTGKTTLAMAPAAGLSSGKPWPDGSPCTAACVVVWSGEDDPSDTLVPRLIASSAERKKVCFVPDVVVNGECKAFDPSTDIDLLAKEIDRLGNVGLLIIDPIVSAIAGDSHKNSEVRRGLQPLVDLAAKRGIAIIGITHLSKGTSGSSPGERVTGSLAFNAVARTTIFAFTKTEADADGEMLTRRYFMRGKSNIGPDSGGFEYSLKQEMVRGYPSITASVVEWGEAVEGSTREKMAEAESADSEGSEGGAVTEAKEFLAVLLAHSSMPAKQVQSEARESGISPASLRRAQKALKIKPSKSAMAGGWIWSLPRTCSSSTEHAHSQGVNTFGKSEHLQATGTDAEVF